MSFPNLAGKHAFDSLLTPAQWLEYLSEVRPEVVVSCEPGAVLLYDIGVWERVRDEAEATPRRRICLAAPGVMAAGGFGMGSPAAANMLEYLIASGVQRVLTIGLAGALQPGMEPGDVVVCTGAVRDEGVSHHYLASDVEVGPDAALADELKASLDRAAIPWTSARTWTTDAPWRETAEEVRHYRGLGVATVEMEAAALFAVGAVRGVSVAAAFVVSDLLTDEGWVPQFHHDDTRSRLDALWDAAVATLTS